MRERGFELLVFCGVRPPLIASGLDDSYVLLGVFVPPVFRENQKMVERRRPMRTFKISDELYERLKGFVVDPFDDTPDVVIARLIEIVEKARNRWSPFEKHPSVHEDPYPMDSPQESRVPDREEQEVIL
jgi:hypothetical protein